MGELALPPKAQRETLALKTAAGVQARRKAVARWVTAPDPVV